MKRLPVWVHICAYFYIRILYICRSQWPRGLRRGSAAAVLLELRVRIPPGAWIYVCSECCVLSGRGLCDGPITHPEESYRVWCVLMLSWSLDNEEALAVAPLKQIYTYIVCVYLYINIYIMYA